jgi:hypothetical protein
MPHGPIPDKPEQLIDETEQALGAIADIDAAVTAFRGDHSADVQQGREQMLASLDCPVIRIQGLPTGTFYILNSPPTNGAFVHHPDVARAFEDGATEVVVCGEAPPSQ